LCAQKTVLVPTPLCPSEFTTLVVSLVWCGVVWCWIMICPDHKQGYAALLSDFESFFNRRLFNGVSDCWNRPINSCPGSWIRIMERKWYYNAETNKKSLAYVGHPSRQLHLRKVCMCEFVCVCSQPSPMCLLWMSGWMSVTAISSV
jgi:hypothetical protein